MLNQLTVQLNFPIRVLINFWASTRSKQPQSIEVYVYTTGWMNFVTYMKFPLTNQATNLALADIFLLPLPCQAKIMS